MFFGGSLRITRECWAVLGGAFRQVNANGL